VKNIEKMNKVSTIAHIADIHIRKTPTRNAEYEYVFKNLIKSLKEKKPSRIVVAGDLVHDYLDLQGEQLILVSFFLNELSKIAPVRVTRGNHDCRKKNLNRVDSVKAIIEVLQNPNIVYYDKTDFYFDDNVIWAVWHHGEQKNNPWKSKAAKSIEANKAENGYTVIDIFHDPVSGCKSTSGFEMNSKSYYRISDFKGDFSLFGDIHKMQYFDAAKTKAYCGSLVAQDFSEGDDNFHGYLLWDIEAKSVEEVSVKSEYSFKNVLITPYTDFDDLDFEIPNPTKFMKVRFVWGTLPQVRNKDSERKLATYLKSKYNNVTISHINKFLEVDKVQVNENVTLQNITDAAVQHEIFKEYLEKIGVDANMINDVIALDEEILKEIDVSNDESIEWDVIKFGGVNFMSYAKLDIDWRDMDGLFQITGDNTAGKTTIMKIISYVLFNKTLETEFRMKYGDKRFVNNRNGASFCEAYLVIQGNGEYYGIKRRTELTRSKDGEISGAPTTLNYYLLSNPDEEMDVKTSLETLDSDRRVKTQKNIDAIVGTYDNFMRIVMTTSDTLNRILSNDMATFIDSLLFDSGLDIFDKKLEGFKTYQKRVNEKPRVSCNVEFTTTQNSTYTQEINDLDAEIKEIETVKIPDIETRIGTGRTYVENLLKKLYKIDPDIYNLDVDKTKNTVNVHNANIGDFKARQVVLKNSIDVLRETYDSERLSELNQKKEQHKSIEYSNKIKIKNLEQVRMNHDHTIEILKGNVVRLKEQGLKYKNEIVELKKSKTCPTCGQALTSEHQQHIGENIVKIEAEMFSIADKIKNINDVQILDELKKITEIDEEINQINTLIDTQTLEMDDVLTEIGKLTNEKNDVDRRRELLVEYEQIPTKIQNEELKTTILKQKLDNHENSLKQIEQNHKIEAAIELAKQKIHRLELDLNDENENIFIKKTAIGDKQIKIKNNELLITEFKVQEYCDNVMSLYKKCVHRDGIPKQMLSNYILPKINVTLENILSVAPFKVWLDPDDLRPKLAYNNRPTAIIDCISASGKERTFSSVVLKFALNQINVKTKPTIFLLDEVMGKLDENSVEEFIEMLQLIKQNMKKVLVIEHKYEISPDYLLSVSLNEDGISSVVIE
jgi:energy-coupling factor transporter ATP-binding protein EcfA2